MLIIVGRGPPPSPSRPGIRRPLGRRGGVLPGSGGRTEPESMLVLTREPPSAPHSLVGPDAVRFASTGSRRRGPRASPGDRGTHRANGRSGLDQPLLFNPIERHTQMRRRPHPRARPAAPVPRSTLPPLSCARGIALARLPGEYRVNFRNGTDATGLQRDATPAIRGSVRRHR